MGLDWAVTQMLCCEWEIAIHSVNQAFAWALWYTRKEAMG